MQTCTVQKSGNQQNGSENIDYIMYIAFIKSKHSVIQWNITNTA